MEHLGYEDRKRGSCRAEGAQQRGCKEKAQTAVGEGATLYKDRPGRNPDIYYFYANSNLSNSLKRKTNKPSLSVP